MNSTINIGEIGVTETNISMLDEMKDGETRWFIWKMDIEQSLFFSLSDE